MTDVSQFPARDGTRRFVRRSGARVHRTIANSIPILFIDIPFHSTPVRNTLA
jgi:hypothetical protein